MMTSCTLPPDDTMLSINRTCYCYPIDRKTVDDFIIGSSSHPEMGGLLAQRENYFARTSVFLSDTDFAKMMAQISAIENVVASPAFQTKALDRNPTPYAEIQPRSRGAFMGYDFHITADGPRLIEINSNAGGAFIVNALEKSLGLSDGDTEHKIGQMFIDEWQAAGRSGKPKTIAIVDENPTDQFHYPDMHLASDMLSGQGFEIYITDPKKMTYDGEKLLLGKTVIDLVYNRLTDFALDQSHSAHVAQAFANDAVVLTPNPRHHQLYADKQNLALLTNESFVESLNLDNQDRLSLQDIPKTILVTPDNAEELWANRRRFFFKPFAGFGSRGVYRGAKLTKKVWADIINSQYVAQTFIAPPMRALNRDDGKTELKFDVRVYTYAGKKLLLAARVYQGQATNLRTSGGGLAPIITLQA